MLQAREFWRLFYILPVTSNPITIGIEIIMEYLIDCRYSNVSNTSHVKLLDLWMKHEYNVEYPQHCFNVFHEINSYINSAQDKSVTLCYLNIKTRSRDIPFFVLFALRPNLKWLPQSLDCLKFPINYPLFKGI